MHTIDSLKALKLNDLKEVGESFGLKRTFVHNAKRQLVLETILAKQAEFAAAEDITAEAESVAEPTADLKARFDAEVEAGVITVAPEVISEVELSAPEAEHTVRKTRGSKRDQAVYDGVNAAFTHLRKTYKRPNKIWGSMNIGRKEGGLWGYVNMMLDYVEGGFDGAAFTLAGAGAEREVYMLFISGGLEPESEAYCKEQDDVATKVLYALDDAGLEVKQIDWIEGAEATAAFGPKLERGGLAKFSVSLKAAATRVA